MSKSKTTLNPIFKLIFSALLQIWGLLCGVKQQCLNVGLKGHIHYTWLLGLCNKIIVDATVCFCRVFRERMSRVPSRKRNMGEGDSSLNCSGHIRVLLVLFGRQEKYRESETTLQWLHKSEFFILWINYVCENLNLRIF